MPGLILYGKTDCHLCDEAASILASLAREISFDWRRVDIESEPELFERFRYEIPVIQIEGGAELKWPTTRERVRRALAEVGAGA
ncbi:MAG TPA: glutaredoxin family protein [Chloroflexota bacterium]|nr:glutaredoxin family protein [Chloroflexota bacterium]